MSKSRGRMQRTKRRAGQASRRRRARRTQMTTDDGLTMEVRLHAHQPRRRRGKPVTELVQEARVSLTPAQAHRLLRRNRQKRAKKIPVKPPG